MKYSNLGGIEVSAVCLGCDKIELNNESFAFAMLDKFIDGGGTFLDTANLYGKWLPSGLNECEILIGRWLKSRGAYGKVVVATKGAHYALGKMYVPRVNKADIETDLDESLRTLGLDRIDFYWLHRDDENVPVEEIVEIMEGFVRTGKIRLYGGSNYTVARMKQASAYAKSAGLHGFTAVSDCWSPAPRNIPNGDSSIVELRNDELPELAELGLLNIPFNSTARGYFQKRADGELNDNLRALFDNAVTEDAYVAVMKKATDEGVSVQTALLRYMAELETPTIPITSVSRIEQLDAVLAI